MGVRKTLTGYLRKTDADLLRVVKKERKGEMRMANEKKRTNKKGKKSFFQVAVTYVWPFTYIQNKMPIVGKVTFEPCNSVRRCHGNKDAPFLLLKCTHAWYTSILRLASRSKTAKKNRPQRFAYSVRFPRWIFFRLPKPVVPAITDQKAEYYQTSILIRCNLRSILSLFSNLSLRTPLYHGQFVWSQKCQKSDTSVKKKNNWFCPFGVRIRLYSEFHAKRGRRRLLVL